MICFPHDIDREINKSKDTNKKKGTSSLSLLLYGSVATIVANAVTAANWGANSPAYFQKQQLQKGCS